jgi:hypothetical protein
MHDTFRICVALAVIVYLLCINPCHMRISLLSSVLTMSTKHARYQSPFTGRDRTIR